VGKARKVLELTRSVTNHRDQSGTLSRAAVRAQRCGYCIRSVSAAFLGLGGCLYSRRVNVAQPFVLLVSCYKNQRTPLSCLPSPGSAAVYFTVLVLPPPRFRTMATVVASPAFHSSGHAFAPQHTHYLAPTAVYHDPFRAFAPRHHSGTKSPSSAASWRHTESAERTPIATRTTPTYRRSGPSHSRTPSTSSEASSTSWRERSRSPGVTTVELQPVTQEPKPKVEPKAHTALVYTAADLLRLSGSPLVGISAESQAVVNDHVAHQVWRRGPQSGTTPRASRRRRNRGTSKQRSSSGSSTSSTVDDSERSDNYL